MKTNKPKEMKKDNLSFSLGIRMSAISNCS